MIGKFPPSLLNIKVFERRSKKKAKLLVEAFSASKESTYLLKMNYIELNNSITWKDDTVNEKIKNLISSISSGIYKTSFNKKFN